jgi:hypothetical protein
MNTTPMKSDSKPVAASQGLKVKSNVKAGRVATNSNVRSS